MTDAGNEINQFEQREAPPIFEEIKETSQEDIQSPNKNNMSNMPFGLNQTLQTNDHFSRENNYCY
jgi:hypothetical protein